MKKPRKLRRTSNNCGECLYFAEDDRTAPLVDDKDGECDIGGCRVEAGGGACKHFKYDWEINDDGNE